jgi:uncharacterized alkaline shock family protein YloU
MTELAADGGQGTTNIPGMTGTAPTPHGATERQAGPEHRLPNGHARPDLPVRPPFGQGHAPPAQQPGATQQGTAQQGTAQPGTAQPGTAQPGAGQPRPQHPGGQHPGGQPDPRQTPRPGDPRQADPRQADPRQADPRHSTAAPPPATPPGGQSGPSQAGHQAGPPETPPGGAPTGRPQQPGRGVPPRGDGPDRGRTKIAEEVVEKIAGLAARQVQGVHALGGDVARALGSLRERMGIGEGGKADGVSVEMAERRVIVDLVIVVEYGYVIMEVATAVRANVITAVERMLGLQVVEVNIAIDDVHMPAEEDEPVAS